MRTDGQTNGETDMTKLIVVFLNLAPARKYLLALSGYEPRPLSHAVPILGNEYAIPAVAS